MLWKIDEHGGAQRELVGELISDGMRQQSCVFVLELPPTVALGHRRRKGPASEIALMPCTMASVPNRTHSR